MKKQTVAIFEALSHRARLRIVGYLADKPRSTTELARALRINESAIDHHLQIFRAVGLLVSEPTGEPGFHAIDKRRLAEALADLRALAHLDDA